MSNYANFKTVAPANCPDLISVVRVAKTVTGSPAWGGIVTYTLVLTNSGATDPTVQLVQHIAQAGQTPGLGATTSGCRRGKRYPDLGWRCKCQDRVDFHVPPRPTWAVSVRW